MKIYIKAFPERVNKSSSGSNCHLRAQFLRIGAILESSYIASAQHGPPRFIYSPFFLQFDLREIFSGTN